MSDKTILVIDVLWKGWECDGRAWIKERPDGSRYLEMTDHGYHYEAKASALEDRIAEYEAVTAKTREALRLLKGGAK